MSLMYNFALSMWKQRRVDEAYILFQVERSRLTQDEADTILATPQNPVTA